MVEGDCVNENLIDDRKSGAIKLQIVPAQPKTLSHLPTRPPVDLAFHDLVYSVREGRRNRKYCYHFSFDYNFQIFPYLFVTICLIRVSVPMTECTLCVHYWGWPTFIISKVIPVASKWMSAVNDFDWKCIQSSQMIILSWSSIDLFSSFFCVSNQQLFFVANNNAKWAL